MSARPTPPPDTDGAQECIRALERAVEAVAMAHLSDEREHWAHAIEELNTATFWAHWHNGQLFHRFARVMAAQGLAPCSACHAFLPREELIEQTNEYGSGEKGRQSTRMLCRRCLGRENG